VRGQLQVREVCEGIRSDFCYSVTLGKISRWFLRKIVTLCSRPSNPSLGMVSRTTLPQDSNKVMPREVRYKAACGT